jgi:hypothetical protein
MFVRLRLAPEIIEDTNKGRLVMNSLRFPLEMSAMPPSSSPPIEGEA